MKQIETLENKYEQLKEDLSESGDDSRVIYAMISNFQNRIDLLQNVLQKIEEIKPLVDDDKTTFGFVNVVEDARNEKKMKKQIMQTQRLLSNRCRRFRI